MGEKGGYRDEEKKKDIGVRKKEEKEKRERGEGGGREIKVERPGRLDRLTYLCPGW